MRAHLRYARYVLLHKWYVFQAGVMIGLGRSIVYANPWHYWPRWLWRLLVHDLSKLRPSEWRPYAAMFYGLNETQWIVRRTTQAAFDRAWLQHIHRNPHHWQHWLLQQDDGGRKLLLMDAATADEMLADWMGAGTKILKRPTLDQCLALTIVWYMENRTKIQIREATRVRVEETLHILATQQGLIAEAQEIAAAKAARATITIPGR